MYMGYSVTFMQHSSNVLRGGTAPPSSPYHDSHGCMHAVTGTHWSQINATQQLMRMAIVAMVHRLCVIRMATKVSGASPHYVSCRRLVPV